MSIITSSEEYTTDSNIYDIWVTVPKLVGVRALKCGLAPAGGYDRKLKTRVKSSGVLELRWKLEDEVRPAWSTVRSPLYGAYTNRPEMNSLSYYGRGEGRVAIKLSEEIAPMCTCTLGDSYAQGVKSNKKLVLHSLAEVRGQLKREGNPFFFTKEERGDGREQEYCKQLMWLEDDLNRRLSRGDISPEEYHKISCQEAKQLWQEIVEEPRKKRWWSGAHPYIEVQIWTQITPSLIENWIIFDD